MDNLINQVELKAKEWLSSEFNLETREAVEAMLKNEDKTELIDSFYKDLEFGTGGLRGIMGPGSNRINIYTVGMATQGFANYLNATFSDRDEIAVVVGHDVRNNSRLYAETVANIFSANGIKVYLFDDCRPTPEISFAIRHFGAQAGVNITASHNPKEYNGYKAYFDDGAQVMHPHDINIVKEVAQVKITDIKFEANEDKITIIGEQIDKIYQEKIKALSLSPELIDKNSDLKIVYTPIHGVGFPMIPDALRNFGFKNVMGVPEQEIHDGNFPTVASPNPEETSAMQMALVKGKEVDADIIMASDPDADRIGLACKNLEGELVLLNGNQISSLFTYYLAKKHKQDNLLKGNEFMVKTIVTTDLIKEIVEKNDIEFIECYTGFKYIADEIRNREGKNVFIGGGEESFGYLIGDFVRDKDAVSACCIAAELVAWARENGKSLYELLIEIYQEYGFYKELNLNLVKQGKSGQEEIQKMMKQFRCNPPKSFGGSNIVSILDYSNLTQTDVVTNTASEIGFPSTSNVLQFVTEDGTKVSVRPSGTEPKIKFYLSVNDQLKSKDDFHAVNDKLEAKIQKISKELGF